MSRVVKRRDLPSRILGYPRKEWRECDYLEAEVCFAWVDGKLICFTGACHDGQMNLRREGRKV